MKYPALQELNTSREMIEVFSGYNHNLRIGEGEFYDMTNLTSSNYPVLSPRPKRGVYVPGENAETPSHPMGLISKDNLCYVEGITTTDSQGNVHVVGSDFYINGEKEYENLTAEPKTLISMGAYVIIMPDKVYINTNDFSDKGKIEVDLPLETGTVEFEMCKLDGTRHTHFVDKFDDEGNVVGKEEETYETIPKDTVAPSNPKNMDLWIDTSSTPHVLKMYAEDTEMWTSVATTYIKISFPKLATDLTTLLSDNDGVSISGITDPALTDLNTTMVVWKVGTNYLVVTGILDEIASQNLELYPISITRKMPEMDFIIESENRLWGCRYGSQLVNGETVMVNEIYASKLGDFKNWNCFAGISTDSYAATVGSDGDFTGAITHLGYPIFFKENCMHKIYGNYPANYQIQTTACRGVQNGCSKSLAIVNETLYYKSRSAVCAYDGSLPAEISSALGEVAYDDAVAGVLGNKYYISMKDAEEKSHLFVYDAKKGMWHKEDDTQAVEFCNCRGELYYIDYATNQIKTINGSGITDTKATEWSATTGIIGTDSPDKKYISRLNVRLSLDVGTTVRFTAEYDSSGDWEHLFTMSGTTLKTFSIPIRPKRCDHLRLRIDGVGEAKIFSICKTIEQGSDV